MLSLSFCQLADGTHEIWNCLLFKKMSVNDRYAAVREQRLCYGCLGKGHAIKGCKVNGAVSMDASRSKTINYTQKTKEMTLITQST